MRYRWPHSLCSALVLLLITTFADAETVADLTRRATSGEAVAQYELAVKYQNGDGVSRNDGRAFEWFRKAAEQGNPAAQNALGIAYSTGAGTAQDKEEALRWYQKAAQQGYAAALFNVGTAYYNGDGTARDLIKAYAWFLLAKEAGNTPAHEAVARLTGELTAESILGARFFIADNYLSGKELPRTPRRPCGIIAS